MVEFDEEKHSDGCSMSPDGDWRHCCVEHDVAYFNGGTSEMRANADEHLRLCIQLQGLSKGGFMIPIYGVLSWVYWGGVRVGGLPWIPAPWRWGYGEDFQ